MVRVQDILRWTLQTYHEAALAAPTPATVVHRLFSSKANAAWEIKARLNWYARTHTYTRKHSHYGGGIRDNACIISVAHSQTQTSTNRAGGFSSSGSGAPGIDQREECDR